MQSEIPSVGRVAPLLLVALVSAGCSWVAAGQPVKPREPARVIDLEQSTRAIWGEGSLRFVAMRANSTGLYVWSDTGGRSRATNKRSILHFGFDGRLLRATELPQDVVLGVTDVFEADAAGNVVALRQERGAGSRGQDRISLVTVDPRGEIVTGHMLPGFPAAFAASRRGSIFVLLNNGDVVSPDAPTVPISKVNPPSALDAPLTAKWWPLLAADSDGSALMLVDGHLGTFERLTGLVTGPRVEIEEPLVRATIRHLSEVHSHRSQAGGVEQHSMLVALHRFAADEDGRLYFTLMGVRPIEGIAVVRLTPDGAALPTLRLAAPVDTKRPGHDALGRPIPRHTSGDGALMFPQSIAAWNGRIYVLGLHGLLAVYEMP